MELRKILWLIGGAEQRPLSRSECGRLTAVVVELIELEAKLAQANAKIENLRKDIAERGQHEWELGITIGEQNARIERLIAQR